MKKCGLGGGIGGKKNNTKIDEYWRERKNSHQQEEKTNKKTWKNKIKKVFLSSIAIVLLCFFAFSRYPAKKAEADERPVAIIASAFQETHRAGEEFAVDILLDTAGKNIVAVQVVFEYDKNSLQFLSSDTSHSALDMQVMNTTDQEAGRGIIVLGKPTPGVNGQQIQIGTVHFRALNDTVEPTLKLKFNPENIRETSAAILDDGQGTNILEKTDNWWPIPAPIQSPKEESVVFKLSVANLSGKQVRISWTQGPVEGGGYIIERKIKFGVFAEIFESGSGERTFVDQSVKPSTKYIYRVCQTDSGEKKCTKEKKVNTLRRRSIARPHLHIFSEGGKVRLSWSPAYTSDFSLFLERKIEGEEFSTISAMKSGTEHSFSERGLTAEKKYKYRLVVKANEKRSQESKKVRILVP